MIPFNKPFLSGKEIEYIQEAVASGKLSGNGIFTQRCQRFFEQRYGFGKCLLTTSCTDALEMAALLIEAGPGDEIIIPSYTFVSSANPFVMRGATVVFADSYVEQPNLDPEAVERLITPRTKAIVLVHYGGVACDMGAFLDLAKKHDLFLVEDAAQAIDSFYAGKPLGGIGDLGAFSFHETKNIIAGEGGMLSINNPRFAARAEILWEKGTNRTAFFRGEVDKYGWVDVGSSFLPSELTAAFLFAQLEQLEVIQAARFHLWQGYAEGLADLAEAGWFSLPVLPDFATNNAHLFYIVLPSIALRSQLIAHLRQRGILAVFHYLSLHKSPFFAPLYEGQPLPNADRFSDCLLRLPLYFEMTKAEQQQVISAIRSFF